MTLIVGLGNPDKRYLKNRHNVGFMVVDSIIDDLSPSKINKSSFQGELYKSGNLLLLKPSTYMNLSGDSVRSVKEYFNPSKIIVIHDDLDLKFGTLKFKYGGGSGGHNGLKSIDSKIGAEYYRVRVGIGRPERKEMVTSYVLSDFSQEQKKFLTDIVIKAKEATLALVESSVSEVSLKYGMKFDFDKEKSE